MTKNQRLVMVGICALSGNIVGCSSDKNAGSSNVSATGGAVNGTGGSVAATGGALGGSAGASQASGGTVAGPSGGNPPTGGAATGGTSASVQATGGVKTTGGASFATGGAQIATGGASAALGGGPSTGGVPGSGGSNVSTGGASGAGGSSAGGRLGSGGAATGGAGTGGTTAIDPSVTAAISSCIDKLPYGGSTLGATQRAPIITAIVNACSVFAPPGAQWQTWCQMFLVGAINAESSFNPQAGTSGAGGDPSVGLLQIRFSSVVKDFANYGPIDAVTRIGCNFGTVTSSDSYATKGTMMVDVNCNVAIGAWYYFIFASGNGGSTVVWVDQYCMGGGVAGNLHIGMASFLMGGDAAHSSLSGADYYVNEIKGWFDPCVTYTGMHPFELPIQPDTRKYCG